MKKILGFIAIAVVLGSAQQAKAALSLTISGTGIAIASPIVIQDQGAGDQYNTVNTIGKKNTPPFKPAGSAFTLSLGSPQGMFSPPLNPAAPPPLGDVLLQLIANGSVGANTSGAARNLILSLTEDGLGGPGYLNLNFLNELTFTGSPGLTVSYSATFTNADGTSNIGSTLTGAGSNFGAGSPKGPYSLTQTLTLTQVNGGAAASFFATAQLTPVPEPVSILLFGSTVGFVALIMRRKQKAAAQQE